MDNKINDLKWLKRAYFWSRYSPCQRRHVGCVLISEEGKEIAIGRNGTNCEGKPCLRELQHLESGQKSEVCRSLHAEQNAITGVEGDFNSLYGCTCYVTTFPCSTCAKLLIAVGVERVVYGEDYPDDLAKTLFKEAGVAVERMEVKIEESKNDAD